MSGLPLPIVCAWCERIRTGSGRWEEAAGGSPVAEEATHGICPECLVAETREASLAMGCR